MRRALCWAAIAGAARPLRAAAQGLPPALATFLHQTIELDWRGMRDLTDGKAVVRVLASPDQREIALFGIVHIGVPRAFYVTRAADFPSSLHEPSRLRFGIFSDPAAASDVASLSVPHDDVRDLARCRPGSCKVKLSAEAISHLRAVVDFHAPSADSVVNAYVRTRVLEYVAGYRAQGNAALIVYNDQQSKIAAAEIFQSMLSRSPYMYEYVPALERYLEHAPHDRPAGIDEVLFWSEDILPGLPPTIMVTHEVIYAPPDQPGSTLIVSKLLYAAHFLDGGLDLTAVVDATGDPDGAPAGAYLVMLRRVHFDDLPSGGLLNLRGRVTAKLHTRLAASLRDVRTNAERAYGSAAGRSH
jgi:hypothetical protein